MKIYLVGGAVRDELLGLSVKEKDWVVVGATVQEMLQLGYRQVGKDFPVFLHPKTNEEYALARTERKVGRGYTGFTFDTSTHVTLEDDLRRRDLTINAMAKDGDEVLDYYGGKKDLEKKILRHVSEAFAEDPVRILRVARFAARFGEFTVAPETNALMKQMVESGEIDALVPERVWKELKLALSEKYPQRFFEVLKDCGGLDVLFPDAQYFDMSKDGLEINAKDLLLKLARRAFVSRGSSFGILGFQEESFLRFAKFSQNAPPEKVIALCDRYRVPNEYRELALLAAKYLEKINRADSLSAQEILVLLQDTDALRRAERFQQLLLLTQPSSADLLSACLAAAKAIDVKALSQGLSGKEIAEKLAQARVAKIAELLKKA